MPGSSGAPPSGEDWAFEVKWDGYRLAVHVERGRVRIITQGGFDWTSRFPTIAHDAHELAVHSAIFDGEAVVLDERGASDFGALQRALGGRGGKQSAASAILYAFDLLYLDGRDLRALPLAERRDMLEALLPPHTSIRLSVEVNAEGAPTRLPKWASRASSRSGDPRPIDPAAGVNGSRSNALSWKEAFPAKPVTT